MRSDANATTKQPPDVKKMAQDVLTSAVSIRPGVR